MPFCFVEAFANFPTNPQLGPFGKISEFKWSFARSQTLGRESAVGLRLND